MVSKKKSNILDTLCPKSPDQLHEADPRTAVKADGAHWIIDFNCKHCGRSGSVYVDPRNISW